MTWFEIYAAYGAPAFLFAICAGIVAIERKRRGRLPTDQAAKVSFKDALTTNELEIDANVQPRLARLVVKADVNLARQAKIAAALHAELLRRTSGQR